jgi:hypothetical protein
MSLDLGQYCWKKFSPFAKGTTIVNAIEYELSIQEGDGLVLAVYVESCLKGLQSRNQIINITFVIVEVRRYPDTSTPRRYYYSLFS